MENYIVSARKYRPATFDSVVGQLSITSTLKNAIKNNHLAQAFLFCGPRGVGKTTCARILAKTINCFSITENIEACNECESCKSFDEGRSLNISELDGASNNGVDEIRNLIEQVRFSPQIGTHKIYIIDEVHMLSQAAFNAFLKTLEEPPKHAIFILATTEKHKIIPTILSRCQIFDFNRIKIDDISSHLNYIAEQEKITTEQDGLHIIAQKADGALRDALSMFDQIVSFSGGTITYQDVIENLNILDYDYYFKVTDAILTHDVSNNLLLFNEILNNGFDGHNFINGLSEHFRNLLVCQDSKTAILLEVGEGIKEKYISQAKAANINDLINFLNITSKADTQYKSSKNQRLLVEVMLMQLCSNNHLEQEKKKPIINIPFRNSRQNAIKVVKKEPLKTSYQIPEEKKIVLQEEAPTSLKEKIEPSKITSSSTKPSLKIDNGISFSDSISINTTNIKKEEKKVDVSANITDRPKEPYTKEQFATVWNDFKIQLQQKGKSSLAMVFEEIPEIIDDVIKLTVGNKALEEDFRAQQSDFLEFVRTELSNFNIQITTEINKEVSNQKAYTPEEKFVKMSEKNPALKKLVTKLDMDIGYA